MSGELSGKDSQKNGTAIIQNFGYNSAERISQWLIATIHSLAKNQDIALSVSNASMQTAFTALGIPLLIKNACDDVKKFQDYAKEIRKGVDTEVLRAIDGFWDAHDQYLHWVKEHNRNTRALQKIIHACHKHWQAPGVLPPPLPGLNVMGTGNLTGAGSRDPNEKYTTGVGSNGFIDPNSTILYVITFENVADATAAAQLVTVTDQLNANLDWSSVELRGIGFNGEDVNVPTGLQFFDRDGFTVTTDPNPVHVSAVFDTDTGIITWELESVDAVTGGLPADPLAGFLPPNDAEHRGEGYVSFIARPKAGLTAGSVIRNQANIVFDVNDPILTGEVINTIDSNAPTSRVTLLPETMNLQDFPVTWSGNDGAGAGVAFYDVYASVDDGPFVPWLTMTSQTTAIYNGTYGHTYAFYSIVSDLLGHKETDKAVEDTRTSLVTPPDDGDDGGGGSSGGGGGGGGCFLDTTRR